MHEIVRPFGAVLVAPLLPILGLQHLQQGPCRVFGATRQGEIRPVSGRRYCDPHTGHGETGRERTLASYMSGPWKHKTFSFSACVNFDLRTRRRRAAAAATRSDARCQFAPRGYSVKVRGAHIASRLGSTRHRPARGKGRGTTAATTSAEAKPEPRSVPTSPAAKSTSRRRKSCLAMDSLSTLEQSRKPESRVEGKRGVCSSTTNCLVFRKGERRRHED